MGDGSLQVIPTGQFAAVDQVRTARENLVLVGELRHVAPLPSTMSITIRASRSTRPVA